MGIKMAQSLPSIKLQSSSEFISLNSISTVAVGEPFWIQNKGFYSFNIIESDTQPDNTSIDGVHVTSIHGNYSKPTITAGSKEIWAKLNYSNASTIIHVEKL